MTPKQGSVRPDHAIAITAVVSNDDGEILIVKAPDPTGVWELPGGHLERGEDLYQGVKRESFEESGIHIKVGSLIGIYPNISDSRVIFNFLGYYHSGSLTPSEESIEVQWIKKRGFAPNPHTRLYC